MAYKDLLTFESEEECKAYYIENYCNCDIFTHQGIQVNFFPERFEHAFFKNSNRWTKDKKDFCLERAQRIAWIKDVLLDESLKIYAGWDSKRKRNDFQNKVTLVTPDGYVVVIRLVSDNRAKFVTAYVIDDASVFEKIESNPIIYQQAENNLVD